MKRKVTKRPKKKTKKRRKVKTYSKKNANGVVINLQKVADVVGTAGDINRAKNVLTGGGLKAMIPEPTTVAAMLILNAIKL